MNTKSWIGVLAMVLAGNSAAMSVDFDLLDPVMSEGHNGSYYETLKYSSEGVNLRVTGWSSAGDRYSPNPWVVEPASVGMNDGGLGVERARGSTRSAIDNLGLDFDFLMFEFDQEVSLSSINLGFVPRFADTDVSLAAIDEMDVWSVDNIYDANIGSNEVGLSESSATWMIGAFHPAFGFVQDFAWDAFRIDQISVDVNPVPLPAAFWFFATGMGLVAFVRRRAKV